MKKQYIEPQIKVLNIELKNIVAASVGFGDGTKPGSQMDGKSDDEWSDGDSFGW